jgi:hypothetical protein
LQNRRQLSAATGFFAGGYEIKLTANSCIALSSSRNAVNFSMGAHNETLSAIGAIMVSIVRSLGGYKQPFPTPETQSAYHPRAR